MAQSHTHLTGTIGRPITLISQARATGGSQHRGLARFKGVIDDTLQRILLISHELQMTTQGPGSLQRSHR